MLFKCEEYERNNKKFNINYKWFEASEILEDNKKFNICFSFEAPKRDNKTKSRKVITQYNNYRVKKGKYSQTIDAIHLSFDIETTKIDDYKTFMYCWQMGVYCNDYCVIVGDTWEQFIQILEKIKDKYYQSSHNIICWVANLGYEWQFMKHYLTVSSAFFKEEREPIEILHNDFILFKECLSWGKSLAKLAKDYTNLVKLKGDLDYAKYRETYKNHTRKEQRYCDFDVLILLQFSMWFEKQYLVKEQFPKTVTGANRLLMKNEILDIEKIYKRIKQYYPQEKIDYDYIMNLLYRGGFVHGKAKYMCLGGTFENQLLKILKYIFSFDITSSYPASMLYFKYPRGFNKVNVLNYSIDKIIELSENYAFYGTFRFYNIRAKLGHSIESESKCLMITGQKVIDNGRIFKVINGYIDVVLNEYDLMNYKDFYDWDKVQCKDLYISRKEYLPNYFLKILTTNYSLKSSLKFQCLPYAIEKEYTNLTYGMCCTKENIINIEWLQDSQRIVKEPSKKANDYELYKKNKILLPQWGVWISSISRRALLKNVAEMERNGIECYYCDTDSLKFSDIRGVEILQKYNKEIALKRDEMLERLSDFKLDKQFFEDLGMFDNECSKYDNGTLETMAILGAKRYLYTYKKNGIRHYNCVVAGLPKDKYLKKYATSLVNFYKHFNSELVVKNCKLSSYYSDNDKQFTINRLGRKETIKSCLVLRDSDFSMKFSDDWLQLLYTDNKELRLY